MNLFDAGLRERPPDVTNWSLVRAAGSERDTLALPAREILYRQYAPAVYGWARSRGHSVEDAQDLTQSFFEHLISTDWFQKASASKGRFRAYMMTTLRNYASQGARRSSAKKRGAGQSILPIHLEEVIAKVDALNFTGTSPEHAFHRGWALTVMDETLKRLKEKYEAMGQGEVFRILSPWIGAVRSEMTGKYAAAACELGLKESAARTAVHRLREAYRSVLWLRVAEYLHTEDPGAIREELASLAEAC